MKPIFVLQMIASDRYHWFELNQNAIVVHRELTALSECPTLAPDQWLVVLIPGTHVVMTTVELPKMRASERLQAIAFALEERLATDPESIAIVLCDDKTNGTATVGVVDQSYFETLNETLHAANIFPRVMTPDFLALTWEPETWSMVIQNQIVTVRTDKYHGFSADAKNVAVLLPLLLAKNPEKLPKKIRVWQENPVIDVNELQSLTIPFEIQPASTIYFDTQIAAKPALNLLQGKYRPKIKISLLKQNWMICSATVAALILFLMITQLINYFYYRQQSVALESTVLSVYQQIFPGVASVVEPHKRVNHLLSELATASSSSLFTRLLNDSGEVLQRFSTITTQSINFSNKELQITIQSPNTQLVSQCVGAMKAANLTVKQEAAKTVDDGVQVVLTVGV